MTSPGVVSPHTAAIIRRAITQKFLPALGLRLGDFQRPCMACQRFLPRCIPSLIAAMRSTKDRGFPKQRRTTPNKIVIDPEKNRRYHNALADRILFQHAQFTPCKPFSPARCIRLKNSFPILFEYISRKYCAFVIVHRSFQWFDVSTITVTCTRICKKSNRYPAIIFSAHRCFTVGNCDHG